MPFVEARLVLTEAGFTAEVKQIFGLATFQNFRVFSTVEDER
jgi:hypothetical protein